MILYLLLLIIIVFLAFKFIWKPWKLHKWYAQNFRQQGYKVLEVPFQPFGAPFFEYYDIGGKREDDMMGLIKERYPGYDVVLLNIFNTTFIDLLHPDLNQEFLSAEQLPNYPKTEMEFANLKTIIQNGILSSEGKVWKAKRKIIHEIFNFSFLSSITPTIAELADSKLDKMENECEGSEIEYDIYDYTIELAGATIFTCFFGKKLMDEKI